MSDVLAWSPLRGSQALFLAGKHVPDLLYYGGRGFGKTETLLVDFLQDVGRGFGSRYNGLFLRRNYPSLKDAVQKSKRIFWALSPAARFNESDYLWTFPDGETLKFTYIENTDHYEANLHGGEFQWIGGDELSTWKDLDWLDLIPSVLRSPIAAIRLRMRWATNPTGASHNRVKNRYRIGTQPPGVPFVAPGAKLARATIFGNVLENAALIATGYLDTLYGIEDPNRRKAFITGSFDVKAGGALDDLWSTSAHVIDADIPRHWRVRQALDWGEGHPFSVLYGAISPGEALPVRGGGEVYCPRDTIVVFSEIWGAKPGDDAEGVRLTVPEVADLIRAHEDTTPALRGRRIGERIADSAIFQPANKDDVARQFQRKGVEFKPAAKGPGSRKAGLSAIRGRLKAALSGFQEDPALYVTRDCPAWVRVVPTVQRDEKDPDDALKANGDDAYDCTRYLVLVDRPGTVKRDKFRTG